MKNLTGKVITGVTVKNEKDEEYPDNFLKEEDKFEADEERVLWFDPNAKDKADEEKRILQMMQKRPQILKKQKQKMPKQMKKQKAKIRMMLRRKSRNIIFS